MIFRFHEEREWGLTDLSFECRGSMYEGKGVLRWRPERGFHLDAFVDKTDDLRKPGASMPAATHPGGSSVESTFTRSEQRAFPTNGC